jgi:hypothetical protein
MPEQRPVFPLTFAASGLDKESYGGPDELAADVEFLRDTDDPYLAVDSNGQRVRLIIWNLELLLCAVVPMNFDPENLQISRIRGSVGEVMIEADRQGTCHRTLTIKGRTRVEGFEPRTWSEPVAASSTLGEVMPGKWQQFDEAWLRARLGWWP